MAFQNVSTGTIKPYFCHPLTRFIICELLRNYHSPYFTNYLAEITLYDPPLFHVEEDRFFVIIIHILLWNLKLNSGKNCNIFLAKLCGWSSRYIHQERNKIHDSVSWVNNILPSIKFTKMLIVWENMPIGWSLVYSLKKMKPWDIFLETHIVVDSTRWQV